MAEPEPRARSPGRKRLLRGLVQLLVGVSVLLVALDLLRRFDAAEVSIRVGWLAVALLPASCAVFVQVLAWRSLVLGLTGKSLPWGEAVSVYLDAQMARYTPGKIGLLAVRISSAPRLELTPRFMISSLLIELLSWTGVGILVGLATVALALLALPIPLGAWGERMEDVRLLAATLSLAALLGLLGVCSIPRASYPSWLRALVAVPEAEGREHAPLVPKALPLWHALHWASWALSGAVLCLGLGASWAAACFAGGVLCVAVVLGFLAVVAPAGAGVREVVMSLAAAPVLGASSALVLGLTARVVSLVADVSCWALARALRQRGQARAHRAT